MVREVLGESQKEQVHEQGRKGQCRKLPGLYPADEIAEEWEQQDRYDVVRVCVKSDARVVQVEFFDQEKRDDRTGEHERKPVEHEPQFEITIGLVERDNCRHVLQRPLERIHQGTFVTADLEVVHLDRA